MTVAIKNFKSNEIIETFAGVKMITQVVEDDESKEDFVCIHLKDGSNKMINLAVYNLILL